jgi:hypothetical protein
VRIFYPIDEWVYLLGFLRVAWADVPRDLCLFILGTVAYRRQWFTRFPARQGMVWLGVGLFLAGLWYAYDPWLYRAWHVTDAAHGLVIDVFVPFWESFLCLSLCIGLTVLFRERVTVHTRLTRWLVGAEYSAFIIHLFVVLAVQALLTGWVAPPLVKFAMATLISVTVSFLVGGLLRKPLRL